MCSAARGTYSQFTKGFERGKVHEANSKVFPKNNTLWGFQGRLTGGIFATQPEVNNHHSLFPPGVEASGMGKSQCPVSVSIEDDTCCLPHLSLGLWCHHRRCTHPQR